MNAHNITIIHTSHISIISVEIQKNTTTHAICITIVLVIQDLTLTTTMQKIWVDQVLMAIVI